MKLGDNVVIDDKEIRFKFVISSGPGGQNVNKVSSAVELYFDLYNSKSPSQKVKERLIKNLKDNISKNGLIILKSDKYRNQSLNREDVISKFRNLIRKAISVRKARIPTRPSSNSISRRLEDKRYIGNLKKSRRSIKPDRM